MIGFIGAGNMANAIIKGMVASEAVCGEDIMVYDIDNKKVKTVCTLYGSHEASSSIEIAEKCSEIVLAVKPYDFEKLLGELDGNLKQHDPLIVSIAAGNSIDYISSLLSYKPVVARIMPNINATIGEAMSAYCINDRVNDTQKAFVETLCSSIGSVTELDEKYFSAFCAVAGSAPAFVYMFIDELARAAVRFGINKKVALKIATQTVLGSAKMIADSGEHPYELIDKVCSPGGTTIEGVAALNENGFSNAIMQAVKVTCEKDMKLSEKK